MARRDTRVSRYIASRAPFARPILSKLRAAIRGASPALEETVKWGMPAFTYNGKIVCGIAGFKAHCALWFWQGRAVVGDKPTEGMGNFGRIASPKDLPPAGRIAGYVRKAMKLIDDAQGARRRRRAA